MFLVCSREETVAKTQSLTRPNGTSAPLRLIVSQQQSKEDVEAINLLKSQFNGTLEVKYVIRAEGEVLPKLWEADVCYPGLASIRRYVERAVATAKRNH
jgi:hypothetical protein